MAELADARDLKSLIQNGCVGSSPTTCIAQSNKNYHMHGRDKTL